MVGNHQTSRSSSRCFQPNFLFNFSLWAWWRREMVGQRCFFLKKSLPRTLENPSNSICPWSFFWQKCRYCRCLAFSFKLMNQKPFPEQPKNGLMFHFFAGKFSLNTTSRRKWWTFYAYDSERKCNLENWHGACFHLDSMSNHLPNLQSLGSSRLFSGGVYVYIS